MPIIRNCILPDDLYYDVESDLWARFEASGLVTLGLTDVGQSRAGRILVITVRRSVGAEVKRGQVVALLESAKWLNPVRSLFSGRVAEVNDKVPLLRRRLAPATPAERSRRAEPLADGRRGDPALHREAREALPLGARSGR